MLTPQQAFRYGFLLRCAEEGLADDEVDARLKSANVVSDIIDSGRSMFKVVPEVADFGLKAMAVPAAAALGVGGAAGYVLAKAREGTLDPARARKDETIAAYGAYADQVEARNRARAKIMRSRRPSYSPR